MKATSAATVVLLGAGIATSSAQAATVSGTVQSGVMRLADAPVALYRAGAAPGRATRIARTTADSRGRFALSYAAPRGALLYLIAGDAGLAATLGTTRPRRVVVNELTTVATGYALAQFTRNSRIGGPTPGPRNATLMAANLAHAGTGAVGRVLRTAPNGTQTATLATFKSVANMLAPCAREARRCGRLYRLASGLRGPRASSALQAVAGIAANPWRNVKRLFALSQAGPTPYRGALTRRPSAWTLPVRLVGDGKSMDGPGNFAIDADGNVYATNNYEFGADPLVPRCGSDLLLKFTPDGRYAPGSPFQGGGLNGAGYGITLDPNGDVWVGNYGFAAPVPKCPQDRQPPHNSISRFTADGTALSGDAGYVAGDVSWPQGTVSDRNGTIWIANCGNGKVTRMPGDDPGAAVGIDAGLNQAFDVATDAAGNVYVTAVGNSKVAVLDPSGRPGATFDTDTLGVNRPMGIASDSAGNMWIANSGLLNLPCPTAVIDLANRGASLSLLGAGAKPVTDGKHVFTGGGLTIAWGIAIDGNDNVWVSNFAGRRISQFCGVKRKGCRPGAKVGDPISPNGRGYFFDGLTRSTAVEIDPSGNVWATNNWKRLAVQTNPGGYEVVAYVGAAAPIRTPLIGPPAPLLR